MAELQTYSQGDIMRYLQHKMSPKEMHNFEKALMNDPFLADALEGFLASDQTLAAEHLASIQTAFNNNVQKAKVIHLTTKKMAWWKVAAIIIMIVSAGVVTYSVLNNHNFSTGYDPIATAAPRTVTPEKPSVALPDSAFAMVEKLAKTKRLDRGERHRSSKIEQRVQPSSRSHNDLVIVADEDRLGNSNLIAKRSKTAAVMQSTNSDPASRAGRTDHYAQKKRHPDITSTQAQGVPYANVLQKKNGKAIIADTNEKPGVEEPDNAKKIKIDSPGLAANLNTVEHSKEEIRDSVGEDQLTLAEEVVATLAKRKNQSPVVTIDSSMAAEPMEGWVYFEQYMTRQLDSLKATAPPVTKQYIEVEFSINKQGLPTEINVPAALDKTTAARLIQLLANGPPWVIKKADKKVKITIQF